MRRYGNPGQVVDDEGEVKPTGCSGEEAIVAEEDRWEMEQTKV